jgi:hypothetical protein
MRHSNHDVLSVEVNAKEPTFSKFNLIPAKPVARLKEVSGECKKMETNQIAMQQRL